MLACKSTHTRLAGAIITLCALLVACGATSPGGAAVQLVFNKTSYTPGSSAIVTIENGLGVKITVTDHHTDCTYVQLEHFVGGWQLVAPCQRQIATRLVNLAPGSATPQTIGIPTGPGAAGTYQVVLTYNNTLVVSPTFTVG